LQEGFVSSAISSSSHFFLTFFSAREDLQTHGPPIGGQKTGGRVLALGGQGGEAAAAEIANGAWHLIIWSIGLSPYHLLGQSEMDI
jgi:hypothetical protein